MFNFQWAIHYLTVGVNLISTGLYVRCLLVVSLESFISPSHLYKCEAYSIIILLILHGCETWSHAAMEEYRTMVFEQNAENSILT